SWKCNLYYKSHRSKRKTYIKKRTVNPVYIESLRYKVKREELPDKTLNLSVWHNDSRDRIVFLGQVEISFKTWDWGHEKSSQKTRIVKKMHDPVYNHAMVYDGFKTGEVSEACCELTVWDHNTLANQFLGGLRLSLRTRQSYGKKVDWNDLMIEEIQIWKRMLANPNSWAEGELPLRSSMTLRK
uniref:C2 domain-containing protein n=1 Tax=Cyprinus carpio TaxID=7962 RepID=A0A8C1XTQ0_CYPCA